MNPWVGQTVIGQVFVWFVSLGFALLLVSAHLSSHLCNAMLGHFYSKCLHVGVCYPGVFSGHRHMHQSNEHGMHSVGQL